MNSVTTVNRKISDADVIRLNSVGLSLATIGGILECHPTTVTQKLRKLGVDPADTRRSFMEDVFTSLPLAQQDWLADQLGPHRTIKDFVRDALTQRYIASQSTPN